jgi:hypothetical protein
MATSRVIISALKPLAHAPGTPLAPAQNGTLSERPRPPAPAALPSSPNGLWPDGQSVAQLVHSSPRRRSARHGQLQGATSLRLISNSDSHT